MQHELTVLPDADAVAGAAANHLAARARAAAAERGGGAIAISGGRTPWAMLGVLAGLPPGDVPWRDLVLFQVDERLAPDGSPERNLTHIMAALAGVEVRVAAMPVDEADPEAAAGRYAAVLPAAFDLIHLGLGADGHTASLVPGDVVLDVDDRLVALTEAPYQGRRRMTLTYPALARARELMWVVTGGDKVEALAALLAGSTDIPAGRVTALRSIVFADAAATGSER